MKEDHKRRTVPLRLTFFPWCPLIFHEEASLITADSAEVFRHIHPTFLFSAGRTGLFTLRQAVA